LAGASGLGGGFDARPSEPQLLRARGRRADLLRPEFGLVARLDHQQAPRGRQDQAAGLDLDPRNFPERQLDARAAADLKRLRIEVHAGVATRDTREADGGLEFAAHCFLPRERC
jgi:hypothetical protein